MNVETRVECQRSVHDDALAHARAQRVQSDVRRDARRPRSQAAALCKRPASQGNDDLLEGLLNQIVVFGSPLTDDPVQGVIDRVHYSTAKLGRNPRVSTLDARDELLVADDGKAVRRAFAHAAGDHPKEGPRRGGFESGHVDWIVTVHHRSDAAGYDIGITADSAWNGIFG